MKRLTIVLLLFISCIPVRAGSILQVKTIQAGAMPKSDSTCRQRVGAFLNLGPGMSLVSCEIAFTHAGEVHTATYKGRCTNEILKILTLIDAARPKDTVVFSNIYIMQNGAKTKVQDKTIPIQ